MNKLYALGYFLLFAIVLMFTGALFGQSSTTNIYGSCGAKPNALEKLFTNADKVRQKCLDDAFEQFKEQNRRELDELAKLSTNLSAEIKKVAIKSSVGLVQCAPRPGEPARDKNLIKKCEELVVAHNAVSDRMNELTGWNIKPAPRAEDKNSGKEVLPPCPSNDKLNDLRIAATFNRKLFERWERCRADMMGSF